MYFRLYMFYYSQKSTGVYPTASALLSFSFIVIPMIMTAIFLVDLFFFDEQIHSFLKENKPFIYIISSVILIINYLWLTGKKQIQDLQKQYKDETQKEKKYRMILLYLMALFFINSFLLIGPIKWAIYGKPEKEVPQGYCPEKG